MKTDAAYIQVLQDEIKYYKNKFNLQFAEGFKKGQESIKRKNKSGCCCIIDNGGNVVSVCGAHSEWIDEEKEHSAFLEKLLRTLYGDGWDQLTISDAKKIKCLKEE